MKRLLLGCLMLLSLPLIAETNKISNEPDSVYLFAYATNKNSNHNGLHFAWSLDKKNWNTIGHEFSYLKSDYGQWGREKRMLDPFLFRGKDSVWQLVWSVNEYDGVLAHASSSDLIYWFAQSYLVVSKTNCLQPQITNYSNHTYSINFISEENGEKRINDVLTSDFKNYKKPVGFYKTLYKDLRQEIVINGEKQTGTIHKVSWIEVDNLIKKCELATYKQKLYAETASEDHIRFASLKPIDVSLVANVSECKKISDLLIGIFFEDINSAADGGLYAELVRNRDFEYTPADRKGDKNWNNKTAWTLNKPDFSFEISTQDPIHPNNPHYAVLSVSNDGLGLINDGFDGIAIEAGKRYDFSVFSRILEGKSGKLLVRLVGKAGTVYGQAMTKNISKDWKKYEAVIIANETVSDASLEIIPQMTGKIALDMISLFPQKTFKGRKNGLRADLAQVIADINPRFVRFPGGCVAHGDGLGNIYRWENSIGALEARKPMRNIWNYHQTLGLGYYEYFQFCEDIGAEPLPVLAAGVPCQNSSVGGAGQQGGIPMSEMDDYIQSVLNLVEWANGDVKTEWGKKRAEAGHPKPFNLKYIGIGNEDLITDVFEERFTLIFNAVKEKYPEIIIVGTVGPFSEGTDYVEGWRIAAEQNIPIVDEHYYQPPGWFIYNQDYYDRYDRQKSKVYLGEYAAHLPNRPNNIETALAEALFLTTIERNGDIVEMTSYAPLLAKEKRTNWNPDLIYFNNTEVKPTVGYYIQQLYSHNAGDEYLPVVLKTSTNDDKVNKRIAYSIVRDSKTGDVIIKLVNLLPVEVNAKVDLSGLNIPNMLATKTTLSGKPDDKTAKPLIGEITVGNDFKYTMPSYSFTVIRINNLKIVKTK